MVWVVWKAYNEQRSRHGRFDSKIFESANHFWIESNWTAYSNLEASQVPTLTPASKLVFNLPTPQGWKAELIKVTHDHETDALTNTPPSHCYGYIPPGTQLTSLRESLPVVGRIWHETALCLLMYLILTSIASTKFTPQWQAHNWTIARVGTRQHS